jgi:hypothetical protein
MAKNKKQTRRRDPLPENFRSLEEFWKFWDTHSTADYEELMENVDVNINIRSSKIYLPVAKEIVAQLRAQARRHGVSTETLINLWLREKVEQEAHGK